MAIELAKAYVQIVPTTEGIGGKIESALKGETDKAGKSAGASFSSSFGGALKAGGVAIGAITTAVGGATGALTSAISKTAEYGDAIDKSSQKLGVSSSFYQEWDAVLKHSGTSMDGMSATFKKLATASQDASADQVKAFEAIGLSMDEVASMSTEDLFTATITGLQGMEEGTERTALATQLLGRGAMEMGALLNTSSEDTQKMIDTVNSLGGVLSNDAVKASAQYQDSLQDLQTGFTGLQNNLSAQFLPGMSSIMDGLTAIISGGDGAQAISDGVAQLGDAFSNALPQLDSAIQQIMPAIVDAINIALPILMECGASILSSLGEAIIQNLPMLLATATQILLNLVNGISQSLPTLIPEMVNVVLTMTQGLIQNLPLLVDAGIQLLIGLSQGLINSLPILIEMAPQIIDALVNATIQSLPLLMTASVQIITELAKGIITNLPQLVQSAKQIVTSMTNGIRSLSSTFMTSAIELMMKLIAGIKQKASSVVEAIKGVVKDLAQVVKDKASDLVSAGLDLVKGIWNGISDGYGWITGKITGWVSDVIQWIKSKFGIHSPSTLMRDQVGRFIAEGIGLGITDNISAVTDAMDEVADVAKVDVGANLITTTSTRLGEVSSPNSTRGIDYDRLGLSIANAISGMSVKVGEREFGRVVRSAYNYG